MNKRHAKSKWICESRGCAENPSGKFSSKSTCESVCRVKLSTLSRGDTCESVIVDIYDKSKLESLRGVRWVHLQCQSDIFITPVGVSHIKMHSTCSVKHIRSDHHIEVIDTIDNKSLKSLDVLSIDVAICGITTVRAFMGAKVDTLDYVGIEPLSLTNDFNIVYALDATAVDLNNYKVNILKFGGTDLFDMPFDINFLILTNESFDQDLYVGWTTYVVTPPSYNVFRIHRRATAMPLACDWQNQDNCGGCDVDINQELRCQAHCANDKQCSRFRVPYRNNEPDTDFCEQHATLLSRYHDGFEVFATSDIALYSNQRWTRSREQFIVVNNPTRVINIFKYKWNEMTEKLLDGEYDVVVYERQLRWFVRRLDRHAMHKKSKYRGLPYLQDGVIKFVRSHSRADILKWVNESRFFQIDNLLYNIAQNPESLVGFSTLSGTNPRYENLSGLLKIVSRVENRYVLYPYILNRTEDIASFKKHRKDESKIIIFPCETADHMFLLYNANDAWSVFDPNGGLGTDVREHVAHLVGVSGDQILCGSEDGPQAYDDIIPADITGNVGGHCVTWCVLILFCVMFNGNLSLNEIMDNLIDIARVDSTFILRAAHLQHIMSDN